MSLALFPTLKTEVALSNGPKDTTLTWVDISPYVLPGRTGRRGRSSESEVTQTGIRNLRLRNVNGEFDPANLDSPFNSNGRRLLPMRPIRQTATLPNGTSSVVFSGNVLGWPQTWTMNGRYGETQITCVDIFRALQAYKFGLRYFEQVLADAAYRYYRLEAAVGNNGTFPAIGTDSSQTLTYSAGDANATMTTAAPLIGTAGAIKFTWSAASNKTQSIGGASARVFGNITVGVSAPGGVGSSASAEMWWKPDSIPATDGLYMAVMGDAKDTTSTGNVGIHPQIEAHFDAAGPSYKLRYYANNGTFPIGVGVLSPAFPGVVPTAGRTDHIVYRCTIASTTTTLHEVLINGVLVYSTTETGVTNGAVRYVPLGLAGHYNVPSGFVCTWDDFAMYRILLSNGTVQLHYGFVDKYAEFSSQLPGARVNQVLDAIGWPAADRNIDPGTVTLQATGSLNGKTALEVVQAAADAEIGNVFPSAAGKVAFTDRNHSSGALPVWTFGDGPAELPYTADLSIEYDEARIINDWTIVQEGSSPVVQVRVRDTTSDDAFYGRADTKTFPYANTADLTTTADYLLARTKDPHPRVERLVLNIAANPDLLPVYTGLDLGQWVRVRRRPPYAPEILVDCIVEQIVETGDKDVLRLELSLSPKL